ncbi:hypothetical protein PR202_gb07411 [Eleusine coracana subsp. coracana]|uniref:Uncharacterized protein n=1 Tax=Eleusine coracana subsp. coracana TaxID=191504 RepID=A0AAV5E9M5_ELECO|nr:hypothetical protein PR202_gb07411 [Eleusine coracana subsp. coracana]
MESYGAAGTPRPRTSWRPCAGTTTASRAGSGAFAYEGMRASPLSASTANLTRSLRKAASFAHKKPPNGAMPPRRSMSCKENSGGVGAVVLLPSPRRSVPEPRVAGPLEPTTPRRRRSAAGSEDAAAAGKGSAGGALREVMGAKRKEEPEKEEAAHGLRVLTGRLLQWRFANARMEKAMARATSAAENKLFYTWLRVAELRNIQAAKRVVAQRRRQKLKLARMLRPQLPLLASWDQLARPHDDAVDDLGRVLAVACTSVPLAAGAQVHTYTITTTTSSVFTTLAGLTYAATDVRMNLRPCKADLQSLQETVSSCVGTVDKIEAINDTLYATAAATSSVLGELARTIQQEMECLEEATRLASIVTTLQTKELSLRANLMQAKQRLHQGAVGAPMFATSGWCF